MPDVERTVDAVLDAVDPAYVVELARRLVQIPSVYRPDDPAGTEGAAAAFLATELQALGLAVRIEDVAPGRPNIIADWIGDRSGPRLILEGHTDVVTEGDPAAWSMPPFGGVIAGGRLYGRGAADMKGGLAAAAGAVRALRDAAAELWGGVRLAIVADEEGMMLGIKAFIHNGWAEGAAGAIICEPEDNTLCLTQKGALRAIARFQGRMAHGAMPRAGLSPIPAAAALVVQTADLSRRYAARYGRHPMLGEPSITPTVLQAGDLAQLNVIPATAIVALDVRTIPGQRHDDVRGDLAALVAAAAEIPGCLGTLDVVEERPWTETPPELPFVRAVDLACRRVQGRPPRHGGVPGATDGTFLHAWAGIPIVTIGPGDVTIPHQVDEYVRLDDLVEACKIFAAAACYCLGHPA
jgi:succinyl-diaminopimelate desuccinylase